jgi:hypothetical protein
VASPPTSQLGQTEKNSIRANILRSSPESGHPRRGHTGIAFVPNPTLSHALDVLANDADFRDDDFAEIQVGFLRLPSQEIVGLTNIFFNSPALGKMLVVSLATSAEFWAIPEGQVDACRFSIFELDGAKVDNRGLVRLPRGAVLRAVTVIPAKLPLKPSELDFRIVHHVISIVGAEDRCYRGRSIRFPR